MGSVSRQRKVRVEAYTDASGLRQIQEAKVRQAIIRYNEAHKAFPKVKFVIEGATDLGDSWKVVGAAPELGSWDPAVAAPAWWREGGKWEAEVPVPPGNHVFKAILRKADGQYIYEPGNDRVIQVPADRARQVIEVKFKVNTEVPVPVREMAYAR